LHRHFGGFDHHRDTIDDRSAVDVSPRLAAEQHHRNAPRWYDHIRADVDEAPGLVLEQALKFRLFHSRCEGLHVIADIGVDRSDARDTLVQAIAMNLLGVGRYEGGVDRQKTELAAHG